MRLVHAAALVGLLSWFAIVALPPSVASPPQLSKTVVLPVRSLAYALRNRRLVATDKWTGKVHWGFWRDFGYPSWTDALGGRHPGEGLFVVIDLAIYTFSETGHLYALNPRTGKKIWISPTKIGPLGRRAWIQGLEVSNGTLFVTHSQGVIAYGAASGKERWRAGDPDRHHINYPALVSGAAVLIWFHASGGLSSDVTLALDRHTGRLLWEGGGSPVKTEGGKVYLKIIYPPQDGVNEGQGWIELRTLDEKTGRVFDKSALP